MTPTISAAAVIAKIRTVVTLMQAKGYGAPSRRTARHQPPRPIRLLPMRPERLHGRRRHRPAGHRTPESLKPDYVERIVIGIQPRLNFERAAVLKFSARGSKRERRRSQKSAGR